MLFNNIYPPRDLLFHYHISSCSNKCGCVVGKLGWRKRLSLLLSVQYYHQPSLIKTKILSPLLPITFFSSGLLPEIRLYQLVSISRFPQKLKTFIQDSRASALFPYIICTPLCFKNFPSCLYRQEESSQVKHATTPLPVLYSILLLVGPTTSPHYR